jgi:hypothetical protein
MKNCLPALKKTAILLPVMCFLIAGIVPTQAQVTLDGSVSSITAASGSSIAISHTTGTGANRLMLVGVSWNSNTSASTISSVTFTPDGGSALPLTVVISQKHGSNYRYSAICQLLNPPSGQSGTIAVTFSSSVSSGIVAGAVNFYGVNQTSPLGTPNGAYSPSNNMTVTVSLTGLNGDELVFDNVFLGGNPPATLTVGAGQTQLWNANVGNARGASSTEQASGSSVTMSWTAASNSMWVTAAVPINPAPAGPTYTLTAGNDGNGTVTLDPSGGSYASGTTVTLTPVPNSGYMFDEWSGDDAGDIIDTDGIYTIFMDGDKSVTATFIEFVPGTVTLDGSISSNTADANNSSISFSHTTGTGVNRLMLVGVSWNCGSTDRSVSSVTFTPSGEDALTFSTVITEQTGTQLRYSAIYSLPDPPAGVSGTIEITFSGSVSNGIIAGVANFKGVNQASPLGTPGSANGNSTSPSVILSGLEGYELVFDNVFQGASGESQTLTAGAGQTQNWNAWISNTRAASSTEQATGSSVTMSWTAASSSYWAIGAVPINPAPVVDYTLTVTTDGNGSVTLDPAGGTYSDGTTVTLTPVPDTGYGFDHWSGTDAGDIINTGGVYTIMMDDDKSVTANFLLLPTGEVTSTVVPSDDTPRTGDQITATVYIDMSDVDEPDNYLGSYTGTLNWNTSVLSYSSYSGAPPSGFAGAVNTSGAGSGVITFNGASVSGATDLIAIITVTFDVVGAGTSNLDLEYSAMAATPTLKDLLPILTVNDGQVVAEGPPSCNVTQDGAYSSATGDDVNTLDIPHTTGTGTDRLMLVGVSWNCGTTSRSISSVTFGSYTLSNVITQLGENSSGDDRFSAIYSLINPPAGETGNVTITFSGSVSNGIVAGAVNFAGVDQTTPLGTPSGAALTSGSAPTITLNSLNGTELVFDNVFQGATDENQTLTAGAGQTQNWNAFIGNTRAASSTEQATGASVTMSWTAASASVWAIVAVPINPVASNTWIGTTSTDWNTASNWCRGVPGSGTDVVITAYPANQPVITSAAECNDLTINNGASLTIQSGQGLTVNGNLTSNGILTIQSTGETSSGSLIVVGTGTGNVTYQRSIPDDGEPQLWHYVSSPVDPSEITSDKDFYPWDEVPGDWGSITTDIESGMGYTIIGGGSVTYTGTVVTSYVTIDVTSPYRYNSFIDGTEVNYDSREFVQSGDGSHSGAVTRGLTNYGGGGWNLLGNPYTSALNVSDFINENYSTTPSESQFDPNYVAVFLYDGDGYAYIGNEVEGWEPGLSQTDIQAGQGFFVMAMNDNSSFTFTREMQEHGTGAVLLKSARARESWPGLNLTARRGDDESSTLVVYNANMTAGLDPGYDVGLMSSGTDPEIYTSLVEDNSINFARQALPVTDPEKNIVAIGINSKNGGNVIFSAEVVPIKPYKYYLEDRLKGVFTDLGKDTYTVNLPANTFGTGRFYLHTSAGIRRAARPQKDTPGMSDLKIWSSGNSLIIEGSVSDEAVVTVFNMQGRKIFMTNLNDGMYNTISPPVRLKGVYLVEVRDGENVYQAKVVFV